MPVKFKAIIPKNANEAAVMRVLFDAMNDSGADPIKDLERTTQTWRGDKPSWKKTVQAGAGSIVLRIEATGSAEGIQKWSWLDKGTSPHAIRPKGPWALRFKDGFQAKTRPGSFDSTSGGSFGDDVFARSVQHPGFPGRGWQDMLVEKYRPKFWDTMREAMRRAAKASGHGK